MTLVPEDRAQRLHARPVVELRPAPGGVPVLGPPGPGRRAFPPGLPGAVLPPALGGAELRADRAALGAGQPAGLGLGLAADHAGRLADNLYEAAEDGFASMPNRINRVVNGMGQIEELGAKNVANLANAGAAQLDLQGSQEKVISAMKKMQDLTRQMAEDEANRRKEMERIINLSKMFNGSVTEVTGAAGVQAGSNLYQSFIQNELLKTIARNTENAAKIEAR